MSDKSIIFPNLGISLLNVGDGFYIGSFRIAFYGIVIAIGMIVASLFIGYNAKLYKKSATAFSDITLWAIILGIIGARIYYVIFSWDMYKDDLLSIFNLRQGGLAIYGGIIGGLIGVFILSRIKGVSFLSAIDIVIPGVLIGQIFGRWGNFFNREAFGDYTNGPLAMGLPVDSVRSSDDVTALMRENIREIDGIDFILVHPTFLYEILWNTFVFIFLRLIRTRVKREGSIGVLYFLLYGVGRFFIERLRTDQLTIGNSGIPISMVVAALSVIIAIIWIITGKEKKRI